ncbi:MAG: CocE/NonD family hydrolase, partial [Candidatus Hodarchaeota archaeon]
MIPENPFKTFLKPIYKDFERSSEYIKMRDGTKIAAEIILPKGLPEGSKIPVFLVQTRYWRSTIFRFPLNLLWSDLPPYITVFKMLTGQGLGAILVDVRGTGASFGTRFFPFSDEEIGDAKDIMDWIVEQPWSDGRILCWGSSYTGTTAEATVRHCHPALKGVIVNHNSWDIYQNIGFPGGCLNHGFQKAWSQTSKARDDNDTKGFIGVSFLGFLLFKSVRPVESDKKKEELKKAIIEHQKNRHVYDVSQEITFMDDTVEGTDACVEDISIYKYSKEIQKSKVPFYCWSSWTDAGYGDALLARFMTFSNPQHSILGDWNHGAGATANPYYKERKEALPDYKEMTVEWWYFFKKCLDGTVSDEKVLHYYTIGEEKWKKTLVWPLPEQEIQKWYFNANNGLSQLAPAKKEGEDEYQVNFNATSGPNNRWNSPKGVMIKYGNREKPDKLLLTYTSQPLEEDLEITGFPVIHLHMKSTHEDGMVVVFLEDVDEKGNVYHLTDNILRLIHRKISDDPPPYEMVVPYHSFKKKDALPIVPGEPALVSFGLCALSAMVKKGHRLRIAIAGADKDSF